MRLIAYLAMAAIVFLCVGFAANQLIWLAYAFRGVLFAAVLLGLVFIVIRGLR